MIKYIVKLPQFYGAASQNAARRKGNRMNQNGYHPQGMQGYMPQNNRFPQNNINNINKQGYPQAQAGAPQAGYDPYRQQPAQNYAMPGYQAQQNVSAAQNPYMQPAGQGYPPAQPQAGYGYPYPQPAQGGQAPYAAGGYSPAPQQSTGGSYIPQTPYSPGYTSPGYQPPQNNGYQAPQNNGYQAPQGSYPPGYNPYGQMGRASQPNERNAGIPLNGGGYVPQNVHVKRRPPEFREWYLIIIGGILLMLFILAVLVLKNSILKIVTILLAVGTAAVLWIKPLVAENKRLTYTVLALALSLLTAISFLPFMQTADSTKDPSHASARSTPAIQNNQGGVPEIPSDSGAKTQAAAAATPEPAIQDDSLMVRLVSFFNFWNGNRQDEMLALCAPSWQAKQENPRTALFGLLANRRPESCTPESISGTDADTTRRVTLTTTINRNNNKPAEKYRMTIVMVKENNEWYVDPNSLASYDTVETPDPNITATPAPTPTAAVYSNTILYYNPKGGEYYHLDAFCKTVNAKYAPLQGQFTYAELNSDAYKKLKPCNVCGAPLRED